jgi:carboxypeptidase family protein
MKSALRLGRCAAAAIAITAFGLGESRAGAQALYGSMVGTVTDATGSAVPGAAVTAVHLQTNQTRTTTTTGAGVYSFPTLPSGSYTVSVSLSGFQF